MPKLVKDHPMSDDSESQFFANQKFNRMLRLRLASVFLPLAAAIFLWVKLELSWNLEDSLSIGLMKLGLTTFTITSFFFLLLWYLQTGFKDRQILQRELASTQRRNESSADENSKKINDIILEIELLKETSKQISEPISNALVKKIIHEAEPALLLSLEELIEENHEKLAMIEEINESRTLATRRIEEELKRLIRSATTNLALGVAIAITGIIALGIFVFPNIANLFFSSAPLDFSTATTSAIALHYGSRFSLVISIEVLAYFFLRLHRTKLIEIKYYQNELTNLELKYISLAGALRSNDPNTYHKVIDTLSKTERNHILEKGQSTTELKKIEYEHNQLIAITKAMTSIIPKAK